MIEIKPGEATWTGFWRCFGNVLFGVVEVDRGFDRLTIRCRRKLLKYCRKPMPKSYNTTINHMAIATIKSSATSTPNTHKSVKGILRKKSKRQRQAEIARERLWGPQIPQRKPPRHNPSLS